MIGKVLLFFMLLALLGLACVFWVLAQAVTIGR